MNRVISRTFFITGLGRSGTRFLATVLGESRQYRVTHEWKLLPLYHDAKLKHFPVERFFLARHPLASLRPGYGEVNSVLRRTIGVDEPGPERWVERRAIIFRDPREVITSAMNRNSRTEQLFPTVCENILKSFAKLRAIRRRSPLEYRIFRFDEFTRSLDALQAVIDWAGIEDVRAQPSILTEKVNTNTVAWFPKFHNWDGEHRETFDRIAASEELDEEDWHG